jgi:alginate O-acetyltransferase complex protein AlgI
MLFNSYEFLMFYSPAAVLIYWFADRSERWRTWVLILLSVVFYGYWDVRFVPLLVGSILLNWWMVRCFVVAKISAILTAAIVFDLAVLGIMKYLNFFADNLHLLFGIPIAHSTWALPLGLSFFTFHHIMYLIDLRAGRAPLYPLDKYALYICFFPQAIAGPIARWNEVMEQFGKRVFAPGWEYRCAVGIAFVVIGLTEKVMLADPLGRVVDPIYWQALTGDVPDGRSWLAMAFAFQVFFDFAGYSDIAIGLGRIFGVQLPRNFDAPFRSTSMVEFWQRWHMTLGRFLRDYVITPLSRVPIGDGCHRMARALFAILITMALCGLWHGAGWNFVVWGTLQGIAIVIAVWWARHMPSLPASLGWTGTVGAFLVTIVLFRAGSPAAAINIYEGMTALPTDWSGVRTIAIAAFCAIALPPSHVIVGYLTKQPSRHAAAVLAVVTLIVLLHIARFSNYEFIYFQF